MMKKPNHETLQKKSIMLSTVAIGLQAKTTEALKDVMINGIRCIEYYRIIAPLAVVCKVGYVDYDYDYESK